MGMFGTIATLMAVIVVLLIGIWIVAGTVGAARDRAGHRRRRRESRHRQKIDMFKTRPADADGSTRDESA